MQDASFGFATVDLDESPVLAALSGDTVYPLPRLLPSAGASFEAVLTDWDAAVDAVATALEDPASAHLGVPSASVTFRPPGVERPGIWCAGANYFDHVAEMGVTDVEKRSFHFSSPVTVLNGHGHDVRRPGGATKLDWEVELAVVIGRPARRVRTEDVFEHIAGYAVANDVSVRDEDWMRHPIFGIDWTATKNSDGLTPLGPSIVPARFVPDPQNLDLRLTVNGEIRQQSNTSLMIVDIAEQIAALSALVTLQPGDLVLTGTPAGTAAGHGGRYLDDGDVIVAEVAGVGSLQNTLR